MMSTETARSLGELNKRFDKFEHGFEMMSRRLARLETVCERGVYGGRVQGDEGSSESFCEQFAERVTGIVGLREATTSKHWLTKVLWRLLLVMGIVATALVLYSTNREYLQDPTATRVKLVSDRDYKIPIMFLCPQRWFDVQKADDLNLSRDALLYGLSFLHDLHPLTVQNYSAAKEEFFSFYSYRNFSSLLDFYAAIAPDLTLTTDNQTYSSSSSFYHCRGCKPRSTGKAILERMFCYTFKFDPTERGLGVYSSTRSVRIDFKPNTSGIIVEEGGGGTWDWHLYFNPMENVMLSVFPMITVRSFYRSLVRYNEHKFVTLYKSHDPCSYETDYTFATCIAECHNELYLQRIGCGFLWLSNWRAPPQYHCNMLNRVSLGNRTLDEFYASQDNTAVDSMAADVCVSKCPLKCKRNVYETNLQLQNAYSEVERTQVQRLNMTSLEVSLKHGAVYQGGIMELHEVDTYTVTQLINNIGGSLGLFVGATLMTFAQTILFFIDYLLGVRLSRSNVGDRMEQRKV